MAGAATMSSYLSLNQAQRGLLLSVDALTFFFLQFAAFSFTFTCNGDLPEDDSYLLHSFALLCRIRLFLSVALSVASGVQLLIFLHHCDLWGRTYRTHRLLLCCASCCLMLLGPIAAMTVTCGLGMAAKSRFDISDKTSSIWIRSIDLTDLMELSYCGLQGPTFQRPAALTISDLSCPWGGYYHWSKCKEVVDPTFTFQGGCSPRDVLNYEWCFIFLAQVVIFVSCFLTVGLWNCDVLMGVYNRIRATRVTYAMEMFRKSQVNTGSLEKVMEELCS